VGDRQALREISFRHLAGRAYDRLHRRERCPGEEVRPARREQKSQETADDQNGGERLQGVLDRVVGFAGLYHPYRSGRRVDRHGVDVVRGLGGELRRTACGVTGCERPFPDEVADLFLRRKVRRLIEHPATDVPDDEDDPIRGELPHVVLIV
jgi:hypothetical protein